METLNEKKRIVMSERLHRNVNKTLNEITNNPAPGAWKEQVQKTREKYNLTEEVLREGDTTPSDFTKRKIHEAFRERIENEGKKQIKDPLPSRRQPRMEPGPAKTLHAPAGKKRGKYHIQGPHQNAAS